MDEEEKIAEALIGVIEPGSSWVVRGISNDVLVEPYDVVGDRNRVLSLGLQLKLETLNEQLSQAGGGFLIFSLLGVVLGSVGIHLGWFDSLLGEKIVFIKSIWFYLITFVATFYLAGQLGTRKEAAIYRRYREELKRELKRDGLTVAELYAHIKDDEELSNVVECIKNDLSNFEDSGKLY